MDFKYSFSNNLDARYKNLFNSENLGVYTLSIAIFLLPIIFGHANTFPNQLFVGTLVNTMLAISALHLTFKKSLPIILLPAIGALASGFIFGSFSLFLVYLTPVIWLGNTVYVFLIKKLKVVNNLNYALSIFASSLIKATTIFSFTFLLVYFSIVPEIFLVPMGLLQFGTALLGGLLAGITLLKK